MSKTGINRYLKLFRVRKKLIINNINSLAKQLNDITELQNYKIVKKPQKINKRF